jgi:sigma-B regulation protein RsbU (phosphoserine phosphatase)
MTPIPDPIDLLPAEELRDRVKGLSRLLDVTKSVALQIDLDEILATIAREACRALDCDRASLYQFDPQRNELYTRLTTRLEIDEIRTPIEHGITGYVARTRRVANVPDPPGDPRWNGDIDRQTGYRTRNILAAPVVSLNDGSLLGVLQLLNKRVGAFDAFDEELVQAFSQHAAVALDRAALVTELRRKEAAELSLHIARGIQRSFIPTEMPSVPGYEFAVWCRPNEAVGGDYCDIVPIAVKGSKQGETCYERIGLAIADVSGHGLGPSLIMASVRAAFRALVVRHGSPQELLEMLERSMAADLRDGLFVTMIVAQLDPGRHRVTFANAGHAPALHYFAAGDRFSPLESTGMPLGISEDEEYPQGPPFSMEPSDVLLLCTDGIVEASSPRGEFFGEARLRELIRRNRKLPARELVELIAREVTAHNAEQTTDDDQTILLVRRTG